MYYSDFLTQKEYEMARRKKNGFDVEQASSNNLADMGGAINAVIKRNEGTLDAIKVELRARAGNIPKDEKMNVVGEDYTVDVGVVPSKVSLKTLGNEEIIEMLGQDIFNLAAVFPIGKLKEYLSKPDYDKLLGEPEDGTRSVSFKERSDRE